MWELTVSYVRFRLSMELKYLPKPLNIKDLQTYKGICQVNLTRLFFVDKFVRILYNADCPNSNNYEGDLHGSYF